MITSTVPGLKKLADLLKREAHDNVVMIGGAPVTDSLAAAYAADGFAPDCITAVKVGETLIDSVKSRRLAREQDTKSG